MPGNNINKYSYEKAKKSNYYNEKQNDDLEDLDNIIEEDSAIKTKRKENKKRKGQIRKKKKRKIEKRIKK